MRMKVGERCKRRTKTCSSQRRTLVGKRLDGERGLRVTNFVENVPKRTLRKSRIQRRRRRRRRWKISTCLRWSQITRICHLVLHHLRLLPSLWRKTLLLRRLSKRKRRRKKRKKNVNRLQKACQ